MSQVFLDSTGRSGDFFEIRGAEAHHLIRVVRAKAGDAVFLFDRSGHRFKAVLSDIDVQGPIARGRITEELSSRAQRFSLRLFQGLPKGQKFDFVVEKAVELGADSIVPFFSEKSPMDGVGEAKLDRWKRLVEAACKQCNRASVPDVAHPQPLKDLAVPMSQGTTLVLEERGKPASEILPELRRSTGDSGIINLVVGPESGFSSGELDWLAGQKARLVTLGATTLRTETAGLAALSIVGYELNQKQK